MSSFSSRRLSVPVYVLFGYSSGCAAYVYLESDLSRLVQKTTSVAIGDKAPSRSVIGPRGGVYSTSDTHVVKQVDSCGLEPGQKDNCH